jgi:dTDP-4-dehydrorhamnose 3,5-epimerase-like enzyme
MSDLITDQVILLREGIEILNRILDAQRKVKIPEGLAIDLEVLDDIKTTLYLCIKEICIILDHITGGFKI